MEDTTFRQFAIAAESGSHDDLDRRPSSPNRVSQLSTVHGAEHICVSEYNADIVATFKDSDRRVCVDRTDCLKPLLVTPKPQ
jgi:hypothetical protein